MACSDTSLAFSKATTAVGWSAVVVCALGVLYTFLRVTCCCRAAPAARARGGCCAHEAVPIHALPLSCLLGSLRVAQSMGKVKTGDTVRVRAYGDSSPAVPIQLRLGADELEPPAPAGALARAVSGKLQPGSFKVVSAGAYLRLASVDGRPVAWTAPGTAWNQVCILLLLRLDPSLRQAAR